MNKLLASAGIALGALVVAPKFIGSVVQIERENAIAEMNAASASQISITTSQYTTGWFGAEVTSEVKVAIEEAESEVTFIIEEQLSFGPLMFADNHWHLGLGYSSMKVNLTSLEVETEIANLIKDKLHVGALLEFNKNITTYVNIDKIDYEGIEAHLVSEPVSGEFSIVDNNMFHGAFSWAGFDLKSIDGHVVVDSLTMTTEQHVVGGSYLDGTAILTGDANVAVGEINIFEDDAKVFSLQKFNGSSDVSLTDDLLALAFDYNAEVISASGQYFNKPNLELRLANIDINAVQELNQTMSDLSANPTIQNGDEKLLEALSNIVDKVLAKEPNLAIKDLSVVTEEGKIASEFNFAINEDLFDSKNLNSMALMQALEATAKGTIPMAFLTKLGVAPMVDDFINQGYLSRKENDISFDAKYVENQLTVNGKAFQM